ncbi:hypothetical protein QE152_g30247 [Popillia japonica]|uniref:Transposable element P transposase-like RNase H C-terminal domain-containing protein n=1 Tax=Popillia japonica TaxID=7064 RepID=A0AAW1JF19_POPJA
MTSMLGIYEQYVKTEKLRYLLTYKCSRDHLELFFCFIRARNGWNNTPSPLQFSRSYKRLLLHADVSGSTGNCRVLESTSILSVSIKTPSKSNRFARYQRCKKT